MKKIILFVWVLMLLLVPVLNARADFPELPVSFIPDNVQWVIHVDMKRFRAAEVGELLKEERTEWVAEVNQKMMEELKIDLVNKITSITAFGSRHERKNSVMLLSGDFDRRHIISQLEKKKGYKTEKVGKYVIHKFKGSDFCTFLNDRLLMFDLDSKEMEGLDNVLAVLSGKKKNLTASRLMGIISGMPENAFLIAVAEDIAGLDDDEEASLFLKKTSLATFSAGEKAGKLMVACRLVTDTPETARNIQDMVNGFKALGRMKMDENEELFRIVDSISLAVSGNQLDFNLEYPSKDFLELVNQRRSHRKHSH